MPKDKNSIDIISPERLQFKSSNQSFGEQEVNLQDTPLFFPKGLEKLFLAVYIAVLPYIVGLVFTFIYLAKNDYKLFLSINRETPFFLTWAIGYEILATLLLIYIVKMALSFSVQSSKKGFKKDFKRPS